METAYKISGMMCKHCAARVEKAIMAVAGVSSVEINLEKGIADVKGDAMPDAVMSAVAAAGYRAELA
ncbi:MAG: cation transporter [Clostridium sp.]|nr:cation transporter [Clostridium sp.]